MNGNKKFSNIKSLGFVTISTLASEAQERASQHEQANLERKTSSSLQAKNTVHQLIHAGRICGLRLDFQLMARDPVALQNSPRFIDTLLVDLDNLLDALINSGALKNALDLFSLNFIEQPEFVMSYADGFGDYMCDASRRLVDDCGVVLLVKGYFIHKGFPGSGTQCSYTKLVSTAICTFGAEGACLRLKDRKDNEITENLKAVYLGDVRVNAYKFLKIEKTDATVDFAPDNFGEFDKQGNPVPMSIIAKEDSKSGAESKVAKSEKRKTNKRQKKQSNSLQVGETAESATIAEIISPEESAEAASDPVQDDVADSDTASPTPVVVESSEEGVENV